MDYGEHRNISDNISKEKEQGDLVVGTFIDIPTNLDDKMKFAYKVAANRIALNMKQRKS